MLFRSKRSPYYQGALNEMEWMQEIHKEMGEHGGVEYLYGTQFWWINPENFKLGKFFPLCVVMSMLETRILPSKEEAIEFKVIANFELRLQRIEDWPPITWNRYANSPLISHLYLRPGAPKIASKPVRMGLTKEEYEEDIDWLSRVYKDVTLTRDELNLRWLTRRYLYASRYLKKNPKADLYSCWREGRNHERWFVWVYNLYELFLSITQVDISIREKHRRTR